jgi:ubiquinone/menaquinone biosynthesis C-methylase UbiE
VTRERIQERIAELSPWFYNFDLGPFGSTASILPPHILPIHETRLEMVNRAVDAHFAGGFSQIRCLDVGCHEGYFSVAMARKGMREVRGVDVRTQSLEKARLVAETLGLKNLVFDQQNCEQINTEETGQFELCLFLGVLYHLENPMLALRNIARLTSNLCVIETQVADEVEGYTEWGAREWTKKYHGVLAVIDESDEFYTDIRETGATPLVMCPSPAALEIMLKHAGFRRIDIIAPPPGAYEQHARGKRLVCAAYK